MDRNEKEESVRQPEARVHQGKMIRLPNQTSYGHVRSCARPLCSVLSRCHLLPHAHWSNLQAWYLAFMVQPTAQASEQ
eukprot:1160648-Pelagomonas_calceolata.AAC.3